MAERVQETLALVKTEEEATTIAEARLNELLGQGHRVIRVDVEPTNVSGEALYAVRAVYDRLTPEEIAAEQQAAAKEAASPEAAAAAAASRALRRGLWWKVLLGAVPLAGAVGVLGWLGYRKFRA